jgi:hypothetical protein
VSLKLLVEEKLDELSLKLLVEEKLEASLKPLVATSELVKNVVPPAAWTGSCERAAESASAESCEGE